MSSRMFIAAPQKQALRAASQLAEANSRYQEVEAALQTERGRSAALEVRTFLGLISEAGS